MFDRKSPLRRLAAGVGAFALVAAGLLGTNTASADEQSTPSAGDIVGSVGTLTVHKHAGDPDNGGTNRDGNLLNPAPEGAALKGVTFTVQRVSYKDTPIDLKTTEGWDIAASATPGNVTSGDFTLTDAEEKATGDDGTATFADLPYGLYLVTETDPGTNQIVSPVAPFLVSIPFPNADKWLYDVHVYPKNMVNTTTPTKEVADPGQKLVVGDTLMWTVTAQIPKLATNDTFDDFSVSDTFDPRLSIDDPSKVIVTLDGIKLTQDYSIQSSTVGSSTKLVVSLDGEALKNLHKSSGKDLVITFPTVVKEVTGAGFFENEAFVNTNNTVLKTGKPRVSFGAIEITKVNADAETQTLQGAKFELYTAKDGTKIGDTYTTGSNGKITIPGLWVGKGDDTQETYWLKEITAPAGYVTPTGDAAWTEVTVNGGTETVVVNKTTITNTKRQGPTLPLTGGAGTAMFGGLGLLLVVAAVAGSAALRRREATR